MLDKFRLHPLYPLSEELEQMFIGYKACCWTFTSSDNLEYIFIKWEKPTATYDKDYAYIPFKYKGVYTILDVEEHY